MVRSTRVPIWDLFLVPLMRSPSQCSVALTSASVLGHVPLIDHNPRNGAKRAFDICEAQRYKERTVAERMNARLKDEFGANRIYVRTHSKVMCHVMFGILALCADQIMRLLR